MAETIQLSESAVVILSFLMKGIRVPVNEQRLPSLRELAAAGILEVDGSTIRFTEEGMRCRAEILRSEEERIERERYDPPDTELSDIAKETLRRHLAGDKKVTPDNLPAYRELAAARVMIPINGFVGGPEACFRLTYWGLKLSSELTESNG